MLALLTLLAFTPNQGQWPGDTKFALGPVAFDERGLQVQALRLDFAGARPSALRGEHQHKAVTNYLQRGRNVRNVPSFARLRYQALYPGIDAVFYQNARRELEFDFELRAGADPATIRLQSNTPGRIAADGSLRFAGLVLKPPVSYQGKSPRASRFVERDGMIAIEVDHVDRAKPLTVDPVLDVSTFFGGSGGGSGESIANAPDGSLYITGTTNSNNQPVKNALQELFLGSYDIFIAKFDATGRELLWSTYLGTWGDDRATDIAVDAQGNAYVIGYTNSTELPVMNAAQPAYAGGSVVNGGDVYVIKLNAAGNEILYATYLGGSLDDYGRSIAIDKQGRAWIAGSTMSQDFPLVDPLHVYNAQREGFLARLSADGGKLEFSTYLGGALFDEVTQVALGPDGDLYAVGSTQSTDLPTVKAIKDTYGGGVRDVFTLRLKADGSAYAYLTYLGGTLEDQGRGIAVDDQGSAYITGFAGNVGYGGLNSFQNTFRGGSRDFFITKLRPDGSAVIYSAFYGGTSTDEGFSIALTPNREAVVAGLTQSLNLTTARPYQAAIGTTTCRTTPCTADLAMAKVAADGRSLVHATYFGGTGADQARGVVVTPTGGICVTGFTGSANLPLANPFQDTNFGGGANVPFVSCFRDE